MQTGVYAEFESVDAMVAAVSALRARGYRELETYSPYPVPDAETPSAHGGSVLPWIVFGAGVLGAALSYGIQYYVNVLDYPQNAGGRPPHAVPAFIWSTFEGLILLAALTAFLGWMIALRLPQLWHPVFEIEGFERASVDRFWVAVSDGDRCFDLTGTTHELEALGALQVFSALEAA